MRKKLLEITDELSLIKNRLAEITDGVDEDCEAYECLENALDSIDDMIDDIFVAADLLEEE